MQLRRIDLGDDPDAWRAVGFAVDRAGRCGLGGTVVHLQGGGGGFRGWRIEGTDGELDGLATVEDDDDPGSPLDAAHPNGVTGIDHVVITTGDPDRTVARFEAAGLDLRRVRRTNAGGNPVRQCFLWAGDVILEVVGPDVHGPTSDDPARVFGLALVSEDLEGTAAVLGPLLGEPRAAVQPGRRIAGLRTAGTGISLALAVMSPHPR